MRRDESRRGTHECVRHIFRSAVKNCKASGGEDNFRIADRVLAGVNTLKSVLLLTLALMVAVNSYSNYQTLAHAQLRAPSEHRTMARTAFVATAFEAEPVVARGDSKAEL